MSISINVTIYLMANDFLSSTIIPGNEVPNHEHRRLMATLLIVVIIAIIIGIGFWISSINKKPSVIDNTSATNLDDAKRLAQQQIDVANLEASKVTLTPLQQADVVKQLSKSAVTLTEQQKIDTANLLKAAARK